MTHFTQGLGFDLADTLTGDLELATHFLKGAGIAVLEAKALFEYFTLTLGESVEHVADFFLKHGKACLFHGVFSGLVFDEVTEGGIV